MWVASPWGFSEKTIQPARHECHACCLLRAGFLAFQPVVDNTRGTRVEQVASFQKIFRGSQLTWYSFETASLTCTVSFEAIGSLEILIWDGLSLPFAAAWRPGHWHQTLNPWSPRQRLTQLLTQSRRPSRTPHRLRQAETGSRTHLGDDLLAKQTSWLPDRVLHAFQGVDAFAYLRDLHPVNRSRGRCFRDLPFSPFEPNLPIDSSPKSNDCIPANWKKNNKQTIKPWFKWRNFWKKAFMKAY